MPPKAFLSVYMYGFLLRMIWEGIRVYNARKKRQMDILSGLSANGAVMREDRTCLVHMDGRHADRVDRINASPRLLNTKIRCGAVRYVYTVPPGGDRTWKCAQKSQNIDISHQDFGGSWPIRILPNEYKMNRDPLSSASCTA